LFLSTFSTGKQADANLNGRHEGEEMLVGVRRA